VSDFLFFPRWHRLHVSYMQAVGALRVLAEQASPDVRLEWADVPHRGGWSRENAWRFSGVPLDARLPAEPGFEGGRLVHLPAGRHGDSGGAFWRDGYRPSPVYSPWNGRSFGPGFARCLGVARGVPALAQYVAAVDAAAGHAKKKLEGPAKERFVCDLVAGTLSLSPAHRRWCRACWWLRMPPTAAPGKKRRGPAPKPTLRARPLLGAGGCEGSADYGCAFLRSAIEHFGGRLPPGVRNDTGPVGLAWPDTTCWAPLDVLLAIEGALSVSYPWPDDPAQELAAAGTQPVPWHTPTGSPRGELALPVWDGARTWPEVRELLAAGWRHDLPAGRHDVEHWAATERHLRVAPRAVSQLCPIRASADAQLMRWQSAAPEGRMLVEAPHRQEVVVSWVVSPQEGNIEWVDVACDGYPQCPEDLGLPSSDRFDSARQWRRAVVATVREQFPDAAIRETTRRRRRN